MRDLRLVGGFDILFGKVKEFIQAELFETPVDLNDLNTLRNLSEIEATRSLFDTFKAAINGLTVQDRGTTEIRNTIKLSKVRPHVVDDQAHLVPKKSVFNKIVGDSDFEMEVAAFLDNCKDVISFAKNTLATQFRIEYQNADGSIANYIPDFLVKRTDSEIWVIETKGREDVDDKRKWERLQQWCVDATALNGGRQFRPLHVKEENWDRYRPRNFSDLIQTSK